MQKNLLAIVARAVNYRDHDRVLTLITRDNGRMTVSARGCRKAQSKLLACAQPFCYGDYELYTRNGHEYVRQCSIREIFYDLRLRPDAMEAAAFACRVCEMLAMPGEAFIRGFSLLLHALKALCQPACNVDAVLAFFLLKQMEFAGFCPQADACILCQTQENITGFDAQNGGVVCAHCRNSVQGCLDVTPAMLSALRTMPQMPSASLPDASRAMQPFASGLLGLLENAFEQITGQAMKKRIFIGWQNQL